MDTLLSQLPSVDDVQYAIHHVFLPPNLPQTGDNPQATAHETALLTTVTDSLQRFGSYADSGVKIVIDTCQHAILRLRDVRDDRGMVNEGKLLEVFCDLDQNGGFIPIYVKEQNAAIIVGHKEDSITFEFFELSPRNEDVMSTQGRLRRCFPASSVSMSMKTFSENKWSSTLAHTIGKMSHQGVAEMKSKVMKAGDTHLEDRDTTDPRIVTDFLATVLSAMGETVEASRLWKNTREEVLWQKAPLPWRRSPVWLLARVALQTFFSRLAPTKNLYKEFMAFLLADILKKAAVHGLPSDTLYCMMAKISRRLLKLDQEVSYPWLLSVDRVLSRTRCTIEKRWEEVMRQSGSSLELQSLSTLDFERGTYASYPELDEFLQQIDSRRKIGSELSFKPLWKATKLNKSIMPSIQGTQSHERTPFDLFTFENWVASCLESWVETNSAEEETCEKLSTAMRSYHRTASRQYSDNPEGLSVMLLTILEMWVSCDKTACRHHSLLSDYDPEVPHQLLQSLVLPFKEQMERLSRIETYVQARHNAAIPRYPSIYSSFGDRKSFPVRYFETSTDHQYLLKQIESQANLEREEKIHEFLRLKAEYKRLMALSNRLDCEYEERVDPWTGAQISKHRHDCKKCTHRNSANSLTIQVHEWPLPRNIPKAQSTVFELQVPKVFNDWRNGTAYLLADVLKSAYDGSKKQDLEQTLKEYLPSYYEACDRRITLVSITKPNVVTHRRDKSIATSTEEQVLVEDGMTYRYYDQEKHAFVSRFKITDDIPLMCTYQLSGQCTSLQKFMFRPFNKPNGMSPNDVIADQAYCPGHLSIEEFKAMATLPVGFRIQWSNILTNLYISTVDFKKADTALLIRQIAYQAGPPLDTMTYRASHHQLQDKGFAERLLRGLSLALDRIRGNWESYHAMGCFIALAARILTLAPSSVISSEALNFLRTCRRITLEWVYILQKKTYNLEDVQQRMEFILRTFQVAHVCVSSFDVDEHHLSDLLADSSEAAVLVECSIVIQTTMHSALQPEDRFHCNLTHRWRHLLYKSRPILLREIVQYRSTCLDLAIRRSWPAYDEGEIWKPISTNEDDWITTCVTGGKVYFNLLTAELLVNGFPLSRLPAKYERAPIYKTLFGRIAIEVMPTNIPGMQFSSKKTHHGYTLFFGTSNSDPNELLLSARKDREMFDLVPSKVFENLLPDYFVNNYAHWYSRKTRMIEFRQKCSPWVSSPTHWTLRNSGTSWKLWKEDQLVVSPRSNTAKFLHEFLRPLESELYIHLIFNPRQSEVDIEMPRLQLRFFLQSGSVKLYSRQFRGMHVDASQSIGTLVGLKSKLVLRDDRGRQKILIPDGQVSWFAYEGHVQVDIEYGTSTRVHQYEVDAKLGCLVDNGNLQSKMRLCYIHALTSYCLPDKLTKKTGTEESLSILQSAACLSFECLCQDNLDILESIAKLSPGRAYYPKHIRVMETITWNSDLSFLSQHGSFYTSVKSILEKSESTKFFYPGAYIQPPKLGHVDILLGKRQSIRGSTFHVSGFGAEDHTDEHDQTYQERDQLPHSKRSIRVFEVSRMICEQRQTLYRKICHDFVPRIWALLDPNDTQGPNELLPDGSVGYDAKWLGETPHLLQKYWCRLHRGLGDTIPRFNKFQTMMCLAAMAYSKSGDSQAIQTLAAFANISSVGLISVPNARYFQLSQGRIAQLNVLKDIAGRKQNIQKFTSCPEASLESRYGETLSELGQRRRQTFQKNQNASIARFASSIHNQWIREILLTPSGNDIETYIKVPVAMEDVRSKWGQWHLNHQFYLYLGKVAASLRQCTVQPISVNQRQAGTEQTSHTGNRRVFINEQDIFQQSVPSLPKLQNSDLNLSHSKVLERIKGDRVTALVDRLKEQASMKHERNYVYDLQKSLESLKGRNLFYSLTHHGDSLLELLQENLSKCWTNFEAIYLSLESAVCLHGQTTSTTSTAAHRHSEQVGSKFMAPRVSPKFFLSQLARPKWQHLPLEWKKAIVVYGIALTSLQRAERMLNLCGNEPDLLKELLNIGHTNWDPLDYPESLLLEVESGIMIREVQEEIASQMRSPPTNSNAVMQLNMGEGKSSVILPMIAAYLADGATLVRAVVAKPQAKELFRTLVCKLGRLLGHQIYHMPFSRSLRLTADGASAIESLIKECIANRGILLVQPEHILSFKLMGIECYESGRENIGRVLMDLQHFFNLHSRDIVDESDENFSVKFELVYTMGIQSAIELSPERWGLVQRLLTIVGRKTPLIRKILPESIEVTHSRQGCFPRTRLLRQDAHAMLLKEVAQEICETGFPGFPIARQPTKVRQSVLVYISEPHLSSHQISSVEGNPAFFTESIKGPLLLLRGLIAEGVLGFTLGHKRWRVNYGLDPSRLPKTRLALPFRAKDNPKDRSEFSHPEVLIVLTCLCYYYGGLSDEDLFLAFDHLMKSDQADIEYHEWVKDAPESLDPSFHRLVGINMKDRSQASNLIFPHLRFAKGAVDYFLAHIVFPKEVKEFPQKLSASGWDLGQQKVHPTTGFSGTNDSRHLLPLDVKHLDLEGQCHTNALVLEHLLQPENTVQYLLQQKDAGCSDAETLLQHVIYMDPPVYVILDVGAQILELTNIQVAREWLDVVPIEHQKEAVVFFNDDDEICVINRKGHVEQLQTSSYSEHLDVCLVFLDEAHTRGTDLKLPKDYRAAVTLGANLTKDRLVQGKMRKLGNGQSVVFCIPEEIRSKIYTMKGISKKADIDVSDVLMWAISETYTDLRRNMPLWAVQGDRFQQQRAIWDDITSSTGIKMSPQQAEKFMEEEAQSLEYRYKPTSNTAQDRPHLFSDAQGNRSVAAMLERCEEFDIAHFRSSALQEEQERELSPEIEQERQVERPDPAEPEEHHLDQHVKEFVTTGRIPPRSLVFIPAFQTLGNTRAASYLDVTQLPGSVFTTADFARTVKLRGRSVYADSYQRPVQWIVTSTVNKSLVIISPYEAQELMSQFKESRSVCLHLYAPQQNLAFPALDSLLLYTVPPLNPNWKLPSRQRLELNLFAGQLFLGSFADYKTTCDMLQLAWKPTEEGGIEADGFIAPKLSNAAVVLKKSPVMFLKVLLTRIRRDCKEIGKTHWGKILGGEIMKEEDFEDRENGVEDVV
ncbi:uncharacterized protein BDR25DRAFT_371170 [Lindgomyces ingoldianus]|uniref:Uncharacterized protein n=1 Tax=Lindgomyces ingoldianus TaxID=673940 RepID=A0ACB6RD57_9PLEO|nr:uncharacterized protein BDR25DRAFT_371170 [Lindgomyces ingoldianus]KAF2477189.1 hypothetical protein BDR25DRAFT_371170 [Lindgomyces ingoldianus]